MADDREVVRRFRVLGQVQGVGFRWWTRQHAETLGVRGNVRNRPDGSVEVVAAGLRRSLERLRELLAEGPRSSRVDHVQELPVESEDLPAGFHILR